MSASRSIRRTGSLRYRINFDRMSSFYICTWSSNFYGLPIRLAPPHQVLFDSLVTLASTEKSSETTSSAASIATGILSLATGVLSLATLALGLCVRSSGITSIGTEDVLGVGASLVVGDRATRHATAGRDVVIGLSSLVRVLCDSIAVGRVDDHDHALLAMLGLRAVDVDGLAVGDRDHERGSVAGLAVLVPVLAVTSLTAIGRAVGVSGNGLEVGEDGVPCRLTRGVGVRLSDRVVLYRSVPLHQITQLMLTWATKLKATMSPG